MDSAKLQLILDGIHILNSRASFMSDQLDQINAKLLEISASLDGIAGDIANLKDQIATGMTQEEVDKVQQSLQNLADRVAALDAETPPV